MSELTMKLRKNITEPQFITLGFLEQGRYIIAPNSGMVYDLNTERVVEPVIKGKLVEHRQCGREYVALEDKDGEVVEVGVEILLTRTYYELDDKRVYPHYMDGITTHNRLTNIKLVDSLEGRLDIPKRKTFPRRYEMAKQDREFGRLQDKELIEMTLDIVIRGGVGYYIGDLLMDEAKMNYWTE